MIEDRCTKGINPRDWSFDSSGKAPFPDLRNSLIDLVTRHLAFCFVANAGAAERRRARQRSETTAIGREILPSQYLATALGV